MGGEEIPLTIFVILEKNLPKSCFPSLLNTSLEYLLLLYMDAVEGIV